MTKNIVFLVHGIGQHPAGWSREPDGPIAALDNALKLYPTCFPSDSHIDDYLEFVEICYDDIFDKILNTWEELGKSIPADSGFGWVDEVSRLLGAVDKNTDLFLRYGGDVLLYCGFELVARTIRLRVNSVIATKIYQAYLAAQATAGSVPRFCVVAHSLGTTVAQDALYQLATADWHNEPEVLTSQLPQLAPGQHPVPDAQSDFESVVSGAKQFPDRPVPVDLNALFLISNTIPLLRQAAGDYALCQSTGGDFDCSAVFNVNHRYDPVSLICGGLPPPSPAPRPGWNNVTVQHIHDKNIHDFGHYLSNPAVHGQLFRRLIDPQFSSPCFASALSQAQSPEWTGFGGALAGLDQKVRQALEDRLRDIVTSSPTVQALSPAFRELLSIAGTA